MKSLYLHIGNFKTGSTSLQSFFYLNRRLLKKNNIETIIEKNYFKNTFHKNFFPVSHMILKRFNT